MPKNPLKSFGRRKSSGNVLDDVAAIAPGASPTTSSFRVLERPNSNIQHKFGADADARYPKPSASRPFNSPLDNLRLGKSVDELGLRANPWAGEGNHLNQATTSKQDRASAGTTNSGSSAYYDSSTASARHSSSSTLPSSIDDHRGRESDELFAHRKVAAAPMPEPRGETATANGDVNAAMPAPYASSFRSRAARAFTFGSAKQGPSDSLADVPPVPALLLHDSRQRSPERMLPGSPRERATTTSSYASTTVPTKKGTQTAVPNLQLATSSFGDDFGHIFASFGETKSADNSLQTLSPASAPIFHRAESSPMIPPRALSRQTPSPQPVVTRRDSSSPYSIDDTDPREALMKGSALESPGFEETPNHNSGIARAYLAGSRGQYGAVQEQTSPRLYGFNRTPTDDSFDQTRPLNGSTKPSINAKASSDDDEDSWVRKVSLRQQANVYDKPLPVPAHTSPQGPDGTRGSFGSRDATPRASKFATQEESLFDSSPNGPPSRAVRPAQYSRPQMPATKKMTRAEFERLQKGEDTSREDSEEDHAQGEDEEDEDEVEMERAKQAARQRRKQEANMAVYRQQMKKVTGGGPADLPSAVRPPLDRAPNSAPATPSIHLGGMGGAPPLDALRGKATDDDDDDVPLGILQAHGFPSAGRPPTRLAESDLVSQRRTSGAGSVVGGGAGQGSLPPFARRLPVDPYFGASVVNQANRESLAFGSNGASVYGGAGVMPQQPQNGHPAGLVGVIAGEERARAARRGSPNPTTGTYTSSGATGLPSNMQPPRTMSMGNMTPPGMYNPIGVPQMPMMPGMMSMPGMQQMPMMPPEASQQQIQQFMQMQMQFMQNMIAMQQQSMASPQQDMGPGARLGHRPSSSMSSHAPGNLAVPSTGRSMTMMGPPTSWDVQGLQRPASSYLGNYTPSVHGMNLNGGGPGPGYTPSIAPSERSNIGMPSRYRPVNLGSGEQGNGRTNSMTSSMTLQAFKNQQGGTNRTHSPSRQEQPATIRVIDKLKGSPKIGTRAADDDDEEGWAEMTKKRAAKKFSWRRKDNAKEEQQALSELYQGMD